MAINRVSSGVREGGQFKQSTHAEAAGVSLGAPAVSEGFVSSALESQRNWYRATTPAALAEITSRLNESRNFSDENIAATADEVWREHHGYTAKQEQAFQAAVDALAATGDNEGVQDALAYVAAIKHRHGAASEPAVPETDVYAVPGGGSVHILKPAQPDGVTTPVPSNDPRVQAGEVFDKVVDEDGTVYHRRRDGVYPGSPYAMRLQTNRPLSDDEQMQVAGLMGYAYRAQVRGEPLGDPYRDSPYSFNLGADTTKGRTDDLGMALERFEEELPVLIQEGSPVRTTNRAGWGTKGTRLVEGLNDPDLKFEIYYDDVIED